MVGSAPAGTAAAPSMDLAGSPAARGAASSNAAISGRAARAERSNLGYVIATLPWTIGRASPSAARREISLSVEPRARLLLLPPASTAARRAGRRHPPPPHPRR